MSVDTTATVAEVANKLVEYCRNMEFEKAYTELYAPSIVSIEPKGAPMERTEGMEQLIAKSEQFASMTEEMHGNEVSDPNIGSDFFSVSMKMNVTFKGAPGPIDMDEVCVYEVKDGKIVQEQFFYTPENPEG